MKHINVDLKKLSSGSKQPKDFAKALLGDIKERIRSAQYEALKSVNKELISLY